MRVQCQHSGAPPLFKSSRHFHNYSGDNNDNDNSNNNSNMTYRVDLLYALAVPVSSRQTKKELNLNESLKWMWLLWTDTRTLSVMTELFGLHLKINNGNRNIYRLFHNYNSVRRLTSSWKTESTCSSVLGFPICIYLYWKQAHKQELWIFQDDSHQDSCSDKKKKKFIKQMSIQTIFNWVQVRSKSINKSS